MFTLKTKYIILIQILMSFIIFKKKFMLKRLTLGRQIDKIQLLDQTSTNWKQFCNTNVRVFNNFILHTGNFCLLPIVTTTL